MLFEKNIYLHIKVGADGYQSIVRKNCKFSTTGWSYNQVLNIKYFSYFF